jgi:transposase-like protein
MNLIDVNKQFSTDEQCLAYLEQMRWPDGVVRCPVCGCDRISKITRKAGGKNKRAQIYQCLETTCKQQFSATSGTIFNDSHLPLHKWFLALALVIDAKKGMSANQLKEHLGIGSYRTAWYMCHRIRKAMVDADPKPLSGVVEIDETYIGGNAIRRFQKTPKPKPPKEMVLAMRERGTKDKPGKVRFFHVPDGKRKTLEPIIKANLQQFPHRVYTDASSVYEILFKSEYPKAHRMVNHSEQWIVPGTRIHTNTVESSFSLLKRGLIGSFHRVSIKHLHRYLSEFEFRFNERRNAERFQKTLGHMMQTAPMPYAALTSTEQKT